MFSNYHPQIAILYHFVSQCDTHIILVTAVADTIAKRGISIDRHAELAISAALAAADKGDMAQWQPSAVMPYSFGNCTSGSCRGRRQEDMDRFLKERGHQVDGEDSTVDIRRYTTYLL